MYSKAQETTWIIEVATGRYQHFQRSGYPTEYSDFKARIKRDWELVQTWECAYANMPIHPSVNKFLLREDLEKIGVEKAVILSALESVFGGTVTKLPSLRGQTLTDAKKIQEQYLLQVEVANEKVIKDEMNGRKAVKYDAMVKEYEYRIAKMKIDYENRIRKLQLDLDFYNDH